MADTERTTDMGTGAIHRTNSPDGTAIAGRVQGRGPPLVLIPGGPADGETGWLSLLPHLTDQFTCFTLNTRGRGPSGDHHDHSHERLVEDVVAFVESIDDTVYLFGHSTGGAHALEAAARASEIHGLALYEPALIELADEQLSGRVTDAVRRVRRAVAAGQLTEAAQIFLQDMALANEEELTLLLEVDAAQDMAPLVPVVLEEVDQSGPPHLSDPALLERITMPVLLLHGSQTHPFYTGVVRFLAQHLADCRVREIPKAGHLGPEIEPEPVAAELSTLLHAPAASSSR